MSCAEMRQFLLLFVFVFLAFICGALLSFPLYKILQIFSDISFHKITSQLCSLSGLAFIFLYLHINNILDRTTAGFNITRAAAGQDLSTGLVMGIVIILVLALTMWVLGMLVPEPELDVNLQFLVTILIKAILSGIMVALIEETLYRGALLGGLSKTTNIMTAIIVSSVIYSAVHYIKFPQVPDTADINWLTGFVILAGAFDRFADPAIIDSFLALFAFGVLLSLVRLNRGNIIQCIGLHAGAVFSIKLIKELTDYAHGNNFGFLVNRYDHLLGYLAFAWLLIIIIFYYRFFFRQSRQL
jgi:membrane protease YdiL (CAAX protease family)